MTTFTTASSWLSGLSFYPIISSLMDSLRPIQKLAAEGRSDAAGGTSPHLEELFSGLCLGSFLLRANVPLSRASAPHQVGIAFGLDATTGDHFLLEVTTGGAAKLSFVTQGVSRILHEAAAPKSWISLTIQQELSDHTLVVGFDDGATECMRLEVPELRPGAFASLQGEDVLEVQARGVVVSA